VEPTHGDTPTYHRELDDGSQFLHTKLDAIAGDTEARIVIPDRHTPISHMSRSWSLHNARLTWRRTSPIEPWRTLQNCDATVAEDWEQRCLHRRDAHGCETTDRPEF
jgi:hypothetical protein